MDNRLSEIVILLEDFTSVVHHHADGEANLQHLVDMFLDTRNRIGAIVASIARPEMSEAKKQLESALQIVEVELLRRFGRFLENSEKLKVQGFGSTHAVLLTYILSKPDRRASASELRLIVGDQVHTERRLRDLRDLGFDLQALLENGRDAYRLVTAEQNLDYAVEAQLKSFLKKPKKWSSAEMEFFRKILSAEGHTH